VPGWLLDPLGPLSVCPAHGHLWLTQSAVTGRLIAGMVAGRTPPFDPAPLTIGRFRRGAWHAWPASCMPSAATRGFFMTEADPATRALASIRQAVRDGLPHAEIFARLNHALAGLIGFRVLTVLKLDTATLRSLRLYSSEPSYPIGGTKQHGRNDWSRSVVDRGAVFVTPSLAELRAAYPDSEAIEAVGCGSVIAVPIIGAGGTVGTMNLWHEDGFYDEAKGQRALPFAAALAPLCQP
jgi:hypothetical protein